MKILESFIQGKYGDPNRCEDAIFISDSFVAVIDGVTTKSPRRYNGKTSGKIAAELLVQAMETMPSDADAEELFRCLNQSLEGFTQEQKAVGNEIPRASIILYSQHLKTVYSYGDSQLRLHGTTYHRESRIDLMNGRIRKTVLEEYLNREITTEQLLVEDPGRKIIQPNLDLQYKFENQEGYFGYPVLNGYSFLPSLLQQWKVERNATVVLASDGYPILLDTLQQSENALSEQLSRDPLCLSIPGSCKGLMKEQISIDDRSYARFVI